MNNSLLTSCCQQAADTRAHRREMTRRKEHNYDHSLSRTQFAFGPDPWLLEELGASYEIRPVSIFRPMTGEGEGDPANPHPDRRVPAISHDGELVAESVAIVLYLTDAFPGAGLGPAVGTVGRGAYLTWLAWYAAEFEPAMFAAMGSELAQAPLKQRSHDAVFARLESALSQGPWLMGDHFSGVDLLVGSALNFARSAFGPSALLDDFIARCKARSTALRCVELDDAEGIQLAA